MKGDDFCGNILLYLFLRAGRNYISMIFFFSFFFFYFLSGGIFLLSFLKIVLHVKKDLKW